MLVQGAATQKHNYKSDVLINGGFSFLFFYCYVYQLIYNNVIILGAQSGQKGTSHFSKV